MAVFEELNVQENVDYFCSLYVKDRKKRRDLVEDAIRFVGLEEYRKSYPKKLSGDLPSCPSSAERAGLRRATGLFVPCSK